MLAGGLLSGLALLTKVPAVYLGLIVPLLASAWVAGAVRERCWSTWTIWGLVGLATCLALWPQSLGNPLGTLPGWSSSLGRPAASRTRSGSFFLGQAWGDPGPLFYPLALAFRLTPLGSLGLVALVLLGWPAAPPAGRALAGRARADALRARIPAPDDAGAQEVRSLRAAAGAGPSDPGRALASGCSSGASGRSSPAGRPRLAAAVCLALLTIGQWSAPACGVYPYYMAYFNPLLGGGPAAARQVMVGNGEGMDQVADYFNALPRLTTSGSSAHSFDLLEARCRCDGEPLRERAPSDADYLVVYGRRIQLRRWGPVWSSIFSTVSRCGRSGSTASKWPGSTLGRSSIEAVAVERGADDRRARRDLLARRRRPTGPGAASFCRLSVALLAHAADRAVSVGQRSTATPPSTSRAGFSGRRLFRLPPGPRL